MHEYFKKQVKVISNIWHKLFLLVFFITPFLPMPTGAYGPIAPVLYLFLFFLLMFVFVLGKKIPRYLTNDYFTIVLALHLLLLFLDIMQIIVFGSQEINYAVNRVISIALFVCFTVSILDRSYIENSTVLPSRTLILILQWSLGIYALLLVLQAFQIITIGADTKARSYFGLTLPIRKPLGLFKISDGKIGCMLATGFYLFLTNSYNRIKFIQVKNSKVISLLFFVALVLCQSRSAYLGFLISFFCFCMIIPYRNIKWMFLAIVGLIAPIILSTPIPRLIWLGFVGGGIYEKNVAARSKINQFTFDRFLDSPIIGNGDSDLKLYVGNGEYLGSHNFYLDILANNGLIGFLPYLLTYILFFSLIIASIRTSRKNSNGVLLGLAVWILCSSLHIIVELNLYRGAYNEYVYFFFALGSVLYYNLNGKLRQTQF